MTCLFTSDWWQVPLSNELGPPQLWLAWKMNRTDPEGGARQSQSWVKKKKKQNKTNINTKQQKNKTKQQLQQKRRDPKYSRHWIESHLIISLYKPNKFEIWFFFYSLKTILPMRRTILSWDSLSREERFKTQGKTETSKTVTVNTRNSIEKCRAGAVGKCGKHFRFGDGSDTDDEMSAANKVTF